MPRYANSRSSLFGIPVQPKLRWHDLLPLRDQIDRKTRPVDEDYLLVFGDAPANIGGRPCRTGFTDFDNRRCWVNAECLQTPRAEDQVILTTFIAAHERAHARWTDFVEADFHVKARDGSVLTKGGKPIPDLGLHQLWNILEDERIERLLGRDYPHLADYLEQGSALFMPMLPVVEPTDDPMQVITWVLRRRVFTRAGEFELCPLSESNRELLTEIEPLLDDAFSCTSSRRVVEIAREILKILQLDSESAMGSAMAVLSGMLGERQDGDTAVEDGVDTEEEEKEGTAPGAGDSGDDHKDGDSLATEVKGLLAGAGYNPGSWNRASITPAPYEKLVADVRPYSAKLNQLFCVPPAARRTDYEQTGSRLSVRAALRSPETPFRIDGPITQPGLVALTLAIDDSGSMGSDGKEREARRTAMLCREALPRPHRVRIVLAPSGRVAADPSFGEMDRAFIAGYNSPSGTAYAPVLEEELRALLRLDVRYTRYLGLVADGLSYGSDQDECFKIRRQALRRGVRMFGVGVGLDSEGNEFFKGLFGDQYIEIKDAAQLVTRMNGMLGRIGRQVKARNV